MKRQGAVSSPQSPDKIDAVPPRICPPWDKWRRVKPTPHPPQTPVNTARADDATDKPQATTQPPTSSTQLSDQELLQQLVMCLGGVGSPNAQWGRSKWEKHHPSQQAPRVMSLSPMRDDVPNKTARQRESFRRRWGKCCFLKELLPLHFSGGANPLEQPS